MSSGNLVQIVYAPETVYGVIDTPLSGVTAQTTRFTSESLSGTPTTTSSETIRTDRLSSGLVATGLEVGGSIDYELASDAFFDDWFEAAMMDPWTAAAVLAGETVTLTPNPLDDQEADLVITGDFSTIGVVKGDYLQLVPASGSPVTVQVIEVVSTTECLVATKRGEAAIVAGTYDVQIPQNLVIGKTQQSFTVGKAYQDVLHDVSTDEHSQTYTGSLVNGFSISATYGEIVTGTYETLGNGYIQEAGESYAQQITTAGGTVDPAGTSQPLNASIDFPLVVTGDGAGTISATEFCIESLVLTHTNNLDPSTCIGSIAPKAYTLGTANVDISLSAYLSDTAYDALMPLKESLTPLEISFSAINSFGGYAFRATATQLSFPDPSSDGQDTQTMIEAEGASKVTASGGSSLVIYKLVGDQ